jgi:pSer/pThr/pTyr-binding forkhead associated (FHA) protein
MQLEFGGRRYLVAAGDLVIGSGPESRLVLAAPGVLARHALVRRLGEGMAVVVPAEPGAEILVNGVLLGADPIPLMPGDRIGIAGLDIAVTAPEPAAVAGGPRLVRLTDGREHEVDDLPLTIGSNPDCWVVVPAANVAGRHAEIRTFPEGRILYDLSGGGTLLNGVRVLESAPLEAGDIIGVGPEELRYLGAGPAVPQPADTVLGLPALRQRTASPVLAPNQPPLAALVVRSGERKGERLEVRTPVANIGRADFNDLRLPDPGVAASEARLELREGIWYLALLSPGGGTRVDGEPVKGETALAPGATIAFGQVRLLFEPRYTPPKKVESEVVMQVPLPAAAPDAPVVRGTVLGGGPRRPARRGSRWRGIAIAVGIGVLVLAGYLLFG